MSESSGADRVREIEESIRAIDLAVLDCGFEHSANPMDAIGAVLLAIDLGQPLPPHAGAWLYQALARYRVASNETMDVAMGLRSPGIGPRRSQQQLARREHAIECMGALHALGATIEQAAAMVEARLEGDYKADTLARYFRGSRTSSSARLIRTEMLARWDDQVIEACLAEYPDGDPYGPVAEGKARIRTEVARSRRAGP